MYVHKGYTEGRQEMNYVLTKEGSRLFFEMLKKPNPAAVETLRRGKELLKDVDVSKIGKELVRMIFKTRESKKVMEPSLDEIRLRIGEIKGRLRDLGGDDFMDEGIVPWAGIDESIRPLMIALRRAGVRTTVSCSGVLEDHVVFPMGMGPPYLCVDACMTASEKLKRLEAIMVDVGFCKGRSALRILKEWAKKRGEILSKSQLWEAESRSHSVCFYFDFGTDFDRDEDWDRDYQLIDLPEWQTKIKKAWHEIYRGVLQSLTYHTI